MDWQEGLEIAISKTKHDHFRVLCSDKHPHHHVWRQRVVEIAQGKFPTVPLQNQPPVIPTNVGIENMDWKPCSSCGGKTKTSPPSLATQARTAATAGVQFAISGFKLATAETQSARWAICNTCEHHNKSIHRCIACGCFLKMKIALPREKCPLGKWVEE